jgi:hypothetical protein
MARKDKLNDDNRTTLAALIAAGGEVEADTQIEGVNVRSIPKLVRMGLVTTTETTLTVTDAGYAEQGHDVGQPAEPTPAEQPAEPTPAEQPAEQPADEPTPAPATKPAAKPATGLSREDKANLAGLLFAAAGDIIEGWTTAAAADPTSPTAKIGETDAAEQFAAWLKYLPAKHWDARLPKP